MSNLNEEKISKTKLPTSSKKIKKKRFYDETTMLKVHCEEGL